ncbi:hypothetical protein C8R47DRAFT_1217910 [Mycena vitilis]|nr:hypothetical protein C8R47DRAFT_1217910 [Mycena vitilis]
MPAPDSGPAPPPMTQFVNPARRAHLPFPNLTSSNAHLHPSQFHTGNPDSEHDSQDTAYSSSEDDASSSASEPPPPSRMKSSVPIFGSGSTRTVLDMPLRGSKDTPKLFRGHHAEVEYFIAHYDRLLVKFHVTDPTDQCKLILDYCAPDVQGFIRASKYYQQWNWPKLRREILQSYDADRATSRYKPSDIATYTLKTQSKPFHNLSQWKKYFIKYKTMAGILLQQGHITQVNYDVYFWLGIQLDLRRTLEQRINQLNPTRSFNRQYSVREINVAAEWYFRRNRAEAMVVNAADYGVDLDSDTTDVESEEESEDSNDSDYETYRRKHRAKARAKKAKAKKKSKKTTSTAAGTSKGKTLQTTGTAEEVLSLDTTGIAAKCVQPPRIAPAWFDSGPKGPPRNKEFKGSAPESTGVAGAAPTYPNNIPLGASRTDNFGCFGCGQDGHRIGDCPEIKDLVAKDIVVFDPENRRVRMKNGSFIRRGQGETLAQAAARIAAPRVMFTTASQDYESQYAPRTVYQSAYIEALPSDSESEYDSAQEQREMDAHWYAQPSDPDDASGSDREVYVTVPRGLDGSDQGNNVHAAERTVPSTRTARREVFDGVHLPKRDRSGPSHVTGPNNGPAKAVDQKGKMKDSPDNKPAVKKVRDMLPDLTPADVRVPRNDVDVDMEAPPRVDENLPKERRSPIASVKKQQESSNRKEEEHTSKPAARHSDIQGTVHVPSIIERILDLTIPMTVREAFVSSKEIRTGILETIRLKNVKAVLLGKSHNNPLVANWNWPRTEGILIRVEVETNGKTVTAIIDTGSQLDVVRADVAALKIRHPVNMCKVMSMNDANGGRGELRGYISDVEFNCGGVMTRTDLWVSHQAPFELLLGRPWQRGNLVTIDERDEGTYLVFKDPETRQPRYELLAIPYEVIKDPLPANHLASQSFLYSAGPSKPECSDKNGIMPAASAIRYDKEQCKKRNNGTHLMRGISVPKWFRVAVELLLCGVFWITLGAKRIPTMMARPIRKHLLEPGMSELKGQVFLSRNHPPITLDSKESTHLPVRQDMPLLNPNAPTFHPSSYPHHPQTPFPHLTPRINRIPPDNPLRHEPGARISPLAPITGNTLDCTRVHHFGPETRLPRGGNVLTRVRAASNHQEGRQRQGQPPEVRLGSIVSPQTLFTGHESRPNGQELFHAVFLNARMLINNPLTGHPGMVNGHVLATLVAAPADEHPWPYEVAFSSSPHARNPLAIRDRAAHAAAGPQRQGGPYRLPIDRQNRRVPCPTARAMDIADGIPLAPNWTTAPLPRMRTAAPQRLLPAPSPLPPTFAPPAASPFTTAPLDAVLRERTTLPALPATSPFTFTPLDNAMRGRRAQRGRSNQVGGDLRRARFFLTHPPNEPPKCDTRAMVRFGTDTETCHHVLRPVRTRKGKGKRPDTPAPPFRLLTDRPTLLEDAGRSGEDVSMASVSTRSTNPSPSPLRSPANAEATLHSIPEELTDAPATCTPLPRSWAVSNSRLEKLQQDAKRCAASARLIPTDKVEGFVFNLYKSLEDVASQQPAGIAQSGEGTSQWNEGEDRMETDDPEEYAGQDQRYEAANGFSRHGTDHGPQTGRVRASSSSTLSSLSFSSPNGHGLELASLPAGGNDTTGSQHLEDPFASREPSPPLLDGRSVVHSPRLQPRVLDHSDVESLPSLQELSSDEGVFLEDGSERNSGDELEAQFERIARRPSTPANHDWPTTVEWTRSHAKSVANVRNHQHADALALLRQATELVESLPGILDGEGMQANQHVDTDLINVLADASVSDEGCSNLAQRVQSIRDAVDAHSPGLVDDSPFLHNISSVPVALDGSRHRLLSARALAQPISYRYAIYVLARHYPDWLDAYARLRRLVRAFLRYLEDLFKQRGWPLDKELLHQPAPVPPPYLTPPEYSRFRIFLYTFELRGYADVAGVMADFLRYRFREPEIVSHLLHAGLFDPHDIHRKGARGEVFITRRRALVSYRASQELARFLRDPYFFLQNRIAPRQHAGEDSSA